MVSSLSGLVCLFLKRQQNGLYDYNGEGSPLANGDSVVLGGHAGLQG